MRRKYTAGWFEEIETEVHRRVMELERELTAEIMEAHDVDAGAIEIAGGIAVIVATSRKVSTRTDQPHRGSLLEAASASG